MRFFGLCIACLLLAPPAQSRTWFVARDDSGNFTVIQDAVDAAASGDTIRIGPGRYDEGRIVQTPGWAELVRVLVKVEDLTLIGAGGDRTIIGPTTEWDLSQGWHRGIQTATYWGTRRLVVDGIRFENMAYGINDDDIAELSIRNCTFSGNYYSILDSNGILNIEDSRFLSLKRNGFHLGAWAQDRMYVARCDFEHMPDGAWSQASISYMGVADAEFANCNFRGGANAITAASGSHSHVQKCLFDGQGGSGIFSGSGCSLFVEDCTLVNQKRAFRLSADWDVLRTTVANVASATLVIADRGSGTFRDCILAKGERFVVYDWYGSAKDDGPVVHYDMRNNLWGTDNPDSIQAWIADGVDDPTCNYIIDWRPYTGEPIRLESKNLGNLKGLYR